MGTALARRSEHELLALAAEIRARHRGHLRALRLEVVRGEVTIRGVATCYYGKQLALDEVRHRCRLPVVANLIEVEDDVSDAAS